MTSDQNAGLNNSLASFIAEARWFGGKGRAFEITDVTSLPLAPGVSTALVTLRFTDGGLDPAEREITGGEPETVVYQLPLASYAEAQERLGHARIGSWDGQVHYDAVHDRDAMQAWLRGFADAGDPGQDPRAVFRRTGPHQPDLASHSTLFSGEQSNSSLAFGDDCLLKVFRRITPGINPDVEIHEVLTRAGNTHVASLYGYLEAEVDGEVVQLAMLQQFLRTASDGWELALASARNLLAATDLHAEEAGGDFAAESYRLGATIAEIHAVLADAFGTGERDLAETAATMTRRLEAAVAVVPEIEQHETALTARFQTLSAMGAGPVQRIHGDLHLGQTLRTSLGWKLVDFEGEPAKELAERRLPDSPWRDVAGMIRSFDYAGASMSRDLEASEYDAEAVESRAREWVAHNVQSLLNGYATTRGEQITADEFTVLQAYVADKAIYEAVYETRNRPGWLPIPLAALAALTAEPEPTEAAGPSPATGQAPTS